jgi:hypothetical protein
LWCHHSHIFIVASLPLPHYCGIMLFKKQYETNLSQICGIMPTCSLRHHADLIAASCRLSHIYSGIFASCGIITDLSCGAPGRSSWHSRPISVAEFVPSFLCVVINQRNFLRIMLNKTVSNEFRLKSVLRTFVILIHPLGIGGAKPLIFLKKV